MNGKQFFCMIFLVVFCLTASFADDVTDFYEAWKTESVADIKAANEKFVQKIEEFEKTGDFAVYQVQHPEMAELIVQLKTSVQYTMGGG